jgi:hypothetical protein
MMPPYDVIITLLQRHYNVELLNEINDLREGDRDMKTRSARLFFGVLQELPSGGVKGVGNALERRNADIALAVLYLRIMPSVHFGQAHNVFLGKPQGFAARPDRFSDFHQMAHPSRLWDLSQKYCRAGPNFY